LCHSPSSPARYTCPACSSCKLPSLDGLGSRMQLAQTRLGLLLVAMLAAMSEALWEAVMLVAKSEELWEVLGLPWSECRKHRLHCCPNSSDKWCGRSCGTNCESCSTDRDRTPRWQSARIDGLFWFHTWPKCLVHSQAGLGPSCSALEHLHLALALRFHQLHLLQLGWRTTERKRRRCPLSRKSRNGGGSSRAT